MTNEEFRTVLIVSFIASATGSLVLGACIFLRWISPIWIFILPYALFIAFATYYTVRLLQITRAGRKLRPDITPRPHAG